MCYNSTTSFIGKIGLLLSLLFVFILVSDTSAQCYCVHKKRTVAVRRVPARTYAVRRVYVAPARVYSVKRIYVPASTTVYSTAPAGVARVYSVDRTVSTGNYTSYDADYYDVRRIARDYGFQDGWIDGHDAGMERDKYHPENSGDYHKATNGYEGRFGDKDLYKQAYRTAYLDGYQAGFRSVANRSTYRYIVNY
jgi:hypothetical protein